MLSKLMAEVFRKAFVDGFKWGPFTFTFGRISGFQTTKPLHDRSEVIETARSAYDKQRLRR